jgi:hypothetical protein
MNKMKIKALAASTLALALTIGGGVYASQANAASATSNATQTKAIAKFTQGKSRLGGGFLKQSEQLESLLGLTHEELKEALTSGTSLADLAKQKGVDVQQIIDLQVSSMTTRIDKELAAGTITQAKYDEAKARLTEVATKMVNADFGGRGKEGLKEDLKSKQGRGFIKSSDELASLLDVTQEELKSSLKSGKSLAALAEKRGVDVQKVIDLQVNTAKAKLNQQLTDGKLTQAEYDSRAAELTNFVTKYVHGEFSGKELHKEQKEARAAAQAVPAEETTIAEEQ